ncbi:carboxymethylenebutenolidase [Pseudoduganella sp. DS3]|uniref:Carboxymethylenebutenolidase n=1 Tax=Pseudoduganella guangdongensis TaxID=2692179 RepID=A0A6N9HJN1_9BURK|nr:dienelactone hydrolase family protein [Pseudoduganella guangdongensis]MYN03549.1 carboxymethylenebutenolidase [Pseudoduganella guangdongensis]
MKELQQTGLERRDFIKTAIGTGFAAAVMPVEAQTLVSTDTAGLVAGTIHIQVDGQTVPVYRAQPEGKAKPPVILLVSEIFGVHEHIADVARRFAKAGYLALAPDLFVRQGDPAREPSVAELMKNIISRTPDAQVMADLDAVVEWARTYGADTSRLGITGFCYGGRITWLYSAHNPKVKAGVAWYGRLAGEPTANWPKLPVDVAASLKAPVLGLYGGKDQGIPLETVEQMRAALARAGNSTSQIHVYPDAPHGFYADYRASYRPDVAQDAWQRALAWFKAAGVA